MTTDTDSCMLAMSVCVREVGHGRVYFSSVSVWGRLVYSRTPLSPGATAFAPPSMFDGGGLVQCLCVCTARARVHARRQAGVCR